MIVAVVGSRNFPNLMAVRRRVLLLPDDSLIVSGGARGVDATAEHAAREEGWDWISLRPQEFETMWHTKEFCIEPQMSDGYAHEVFGFLGMWKIRQPAWRSFREAAFARNEYIVKDADLVLVAWDGKSNGTRNAIQQAERHGRVIEYIHP